MFCLAGMVLKRLNVVHIIKRCSLLGSHTILVFSEPNVKAIFRLGLPLGGRRMQGV